MITVDELLERFEYRSDGHLYRRHNSGKSRAGDQLGTAQKRKGQYHRIAVLDGRVFSLQRLIYFIHHGEYQVSIVHLNGDTMDNRIENLRLATASQVSGHQKMKKNNTSGFKGVYYDKVRNRFEASLMVGGKRTKLGRFKTAEEAASAYRDAALQHFGEFARFDSPGGGMIDDTEKELND